MNNVQQNNKWRLRGDKDETINHIISGCGKFEENDYKTWHELAGKIIHSELYKKLKFDHTTSIVFAKTKKEKNTHNILWMFKIHTSPLILAWRPDLVVINKKKKKEKKGTKICLVENFAIPADRKVKIKVSGMRDKYLDLVKELNKLWDTKVTVKPTVVGELGTVLRVLKRDRKKLEIREIIETIQFTEFKKLSRILKRVLETWGDLLSLGPARNKY